MRTSEDKNWEIIGSMLAAESSGRAPRLFSSRRTLFGIPSALDEELAKLDEEAARKADGERKAAGADGRPAAVGSRATCESASGEPATAGEPTAADEPTAAGSRATCESADSPAHSQAAAPPQAAARANSTAGRAQQRVTHPLSPVFDEHSRVLILGTMPSPKSRETGFYYNHPQNRFWKVMAALFDKPIPATNQEKEALVRAHGVALWDVLAECTIQGASDGTIAECVPNDITWLLGQAPVEAVFCTGAKAAELYRKYCEPSTRIPGTRLPSTSPANAATSLAQLIEAYRQILPFCTQE